MSRDCISGTAADLSSPQAGVAAGMQLAAQIVKLEMAYNRYSKLFEFNNIMISLEAYMYAQLKYSSLTTRAGLRHQHT